MPTQDELNQAMFSGISFRKASKPQAEDTAQVKTKAKKKAKIRERRANRGKK
ncbi:MAG: hypothetical protein IKO67_08015 [Bacteroidaceae bacterium]|nr:hypothetical protein [Bacteroidaceae bacterium]